MLKVDEAEKQLGNLKFGKPHKFEYIITNSGEKTIVVTKLVLGCNSCTEASLVKQVLGVGQSTDLQVTFTPGATGLNSKNIIVQYSEGEKAEHLNLTFKAIVTK